MTLASGPTLKALAPVNTAALETNVWHTERPKAVNPALLYHMTPYNGNYIGIQFWKQKMAQKY